MKNSGVEGLLEQATKWEASGEYSKAVDSYLKIMPSNTIDKETTLKCWLKVNETFLIKFIHKNLPNSNLKPP
jgi:hypothetical protein